MKHELNSSDSEKSRLCDENIVGAYDTESKHSKKIFLNLCKNICMSFQANKEFSLEINHIIRRVAPGVFRSTASSFLQICATAVVQCHSLKQQVLL